MNVSGRLCRKAIEKGEHGPPAWNEGAPSVPAALMRKTTSPSGSGAFEATTLYFPSGPGTQRIGEPSGYVPEIAIGTSNVVPTSRNLPSGEITAMVGTRLSLVSVLAVYRSMRGVSLPSLPTDIKRRWSGPNECNT